MSVLTTSPLPLPPVVCGDPIVAGALRWLRKLGGRVEAIEKGDADMSRAEYDRWTDELEHWRERLA